MSFKPQGMADPLEPGGAPGESSTLASTGKAMVAAVISLCLAVLCVFLFHLYIKWLRSRQRRRGGGPRRRREEETPPSPRRGLDPAVLKAIPAIAFGAGEVGEQVECSVCLGSVCEGEKGKVLPQCNHRFHGDCIDVWFQSHSTCPLCRNPVKEISSPEEEEGRSPAIGGSLLGPIPTQLPGCSSTSGRPEGSLVIDVPREVVGEDGEHKWSPMAARLKSFRRLLSVGKRAGPSSPANHLDLEQGMKSQM